jgi:hypothetical protein
MVILPINLVIDLIIRSAPWFWFFGLFRITRHDSTEMQAKALRRARAWH